MKKVLKWIGIVLGGLVGLLVLAAVVLFIVGSSRLNKSYDVQVENISIPSDEAVIARGQHIAETMALCQFCHGDNLEGLVHEDEPILLTLAGSNLTPGRGSAVAAYTDEDWARAIRHGVNTGRRNRLHALEHLP